MILVAAVTASAVTSSGGCGPGDSGAVPRPSGNSALQNRQRAAALLQNALLLLDDQRGKRQAKLTQQEVDAVQARLRGLLNQWLNQTELADTLVLPEETEHVLLGLVQRGHLRRDQVEAIRLQRFTPDDAKHMQACMLLADIARHARGSDSDDLSRARSLFDWVVRNIQLVSADDPDYAALVAFTGPVFNSSLLIGKGTELERAWLFVLLLRQLRMQACYVGRTDADGHFQPRWVGALIRGELYLFDPVLGLPVPSAERGGVATLRELAADPGVVLGRWDAGEGAGDVQGILLRLDASTAFWAPRMRLLQSRLTGMTDPLVLYEELGTPERLSEDAPEVAVAGNLLDRLRAAAGEPRQPLFDGEPIGAVDIAELLRSRIGPPQRARPPVLDAFFFGGGYLGEARNLHLRGQWDDAVKRYHFLFKLYAEIQSDPVEREFRDRFYADLAREMATYWVGMCKYETGDFESAAGNWLRPYLEQFPEGRWIGGARYLLGRCLEAQAREASPDDPETRKRIREAVELFSATEGPQRDGDAVRARRLQHLIE